MADRNSACDYGARDSRIESSYTQHIFFSKKLKVKIYIYIYIYQFKGKVTSSLAHWIKTILRATHMHGRFRFDTPM